MKLLKTKKLALSAMFAAVIAACAWVSIPTPFGVNLAFTLFGVCLASFVLGAKYAFASTAAYIVLGTVGAPVFSQFSSGPGVLFGLSGGFIWGFLIVAILCGVSKNASHPLYKCMINLLAVILCHAAGVIQYSIVTGNNVWAAFLSASLPFLIKDIVLVFVAQMLSKKIKI